MLDWFTTIPGILVLCGVVLLVVAVVLFIMGNKSEKGEKKVENLVADNNNSQDAVQPLTTEEVNTVSAAPLGDSMISSVDTLDVEEDNQTAPVYDFSAPAEESAPVISEPEVTVSDTNKDLDSILGINPVTEPAEEVAASEPVVEAPVADEPFIMPAEPVVEPTIETPVEAPVTEEVAIETPAEVQVEEVPTVEPVSTVTFEMPTVSLPEVEVNKEEQ